MLILFLIALNIAIKYPWITSETGVDAFVMHNLTNTIALDGNAKWITNPLSIFGFYPPSYPSGGMFLTSAFAQTSGLTVHLSILLESVLIGIIGILGAFLLAREIKKDDDLFAFVLAFIFSLDNECLGVSYKNSFHGLYTVFHVDLIKNTQRYFH
jgi:hypothetical protein